MSARYTTPIFAALLFPLFFLGTPAWAAESAPRSTVRLIYERRGMKGCPEEQVFRDVLRARMSYDPFYPDAETRLVVTVRRKGQAYRGRAELRSSEGAVLWPRELGPFADCQSLVEGLGLAVSIKLDPGGSEGPTAPPPLVAAAVASEEDEAVEPEPAPRAAERKARPWITTGASMVLGLGVAPRPALGVAVESGLRLTSWPEALWVAFEVRGFPPAEGHADVGTKLVRTWRLTGAVIPCGHWRMLFGCGVLEMGTIWGTIGTSATGHSQTAQLFHFSAGGRAGAEWRALEHLTLRVSGDVLLSPLRPTLRIEGVPQWTTPLFSGAFQAGLVVSF